MNAPTAALGSTVPDTGDSLCRAGLSAALLADEDALVTALIQAARFDTDDRQRIARVATKLVEAAREGRHAQGGIDSFLAEYALSSEEGVLLLCLAEALLRIPDSATADRLIAGTIGSGDWAKHLGHSDSVLVNASTWGLMLTGHLLDWGGDKSGDLGARVQRLVARSGEPVIREAIRRAMRILGKQFVLGETIQGALDNAGPDMRAGYRFSFDMLGEGARTAEDAERYGGRYTEAASAIELHAGAPEARTDEILHARSGLSVKFSALHPRYVASQEARLRQELVPRVRELALQMRDAWLPLTVDAEEAERLDLSLSIMEPLFADPSLSNWNGLGLAVQAYSKRALPLIAWLAGVAEKTGRRIPVRLVKGAYWDSEIKWAQEAGLAGYPVFTRKVNTDVAYLAAARALLARPDCFYPQFATHNAHTIAAVADLAGDAPYEFQRLFGMGAPVYRHVVESLQTPCRIYAPVGGHRDLLAYLVRRLLENGANTSFVHRLADDEAPIPAIIADPVEKAARLPQKANPAIPVPPDLYGSARRNSLGLPLWDDATRVPLLAAMVEVLEAPASAAPIVAGQEIDTANRMNIVSPHDHRVLVGACALGDEKTVDAALDAAKGAAYEWDQRGGAARAVILERAADLFEAACPRLLALLVREAGKTLANAQSDLREAVDFLRYYAAEARAKFETPVTLKGPTGESNKMSRHGRGVFAAISPWNFPLAIFTGQVAGALAAGNAVVAKPAEQTPLIAAAATRLLHEAGVPGDVLHVLPGPGETIGAALVADERVDGVVITGGTDTGKAIARALAERPGPIPQLIAETGGLNAMIVDSSALPEQVVDDVLRSAFDSAGQRCSALRVLFLQSEIADPVIEMIVGAAKELTLGDPLDYATDIGPVIDADAKAVLEAHKEKMRSEARVLFDPQVDAALTHGTFVAPAIFEISEIGVLEREVFGPILHVVRFDGNRLAKVCAAINATGYGLTLGLHSRIKATADFVAAQVRVGNFYVNRNQIGAVVAVQPFGGEGLSGTGPKAGGPHYLEAFAVERVRTTNLTAAGGNASLLAAGGDDS